MFLTLKKKLSADCFIALIVTIESDLYPSREVPNATEALFFFYPRNGTCPSFEWNRLPLILQALHDPIGFSTSP